MEFMATARESNEPLHLIQSWSVGAFVHMAIVHFAWRILKLRIISSVGNTPKLLCTAINIFIHIPVPFKIGFS